MSSPAASAPRKGTDGTALGDAASATTTAAEWSVADDLDLIASEGLADWLVSQRISLVFGTPPHKLWLLGTDDEGQLSVFDRVFDKVMGLASDGADRLWIATRFEIWRFENVLGPGQRTADGHDRLFIPRHSSLVGDLNIHDLGLQADGRDLWVNTRYDCLASASDTSSFVPRWHPPFLTGPQAGDCCHLNGLAMVDGLPGYVTCVSRSTEVDEWRNGRRDQGVVIDVASEEVVVHGLSMPHSPRWHEGSLWLANAGTGELGRVDLDRGSFEPVVFGPGFLRGLCFVGDYAVVGSSKPRRGDIYSGLALDDALEKRNAPTTPRALRGRSAPGGTGRVVADRRGRCVSSSTSAPSDGAQRPAAIGLRTDEIRTELWFDDQLPLAKGAAVGSGAPEPVVDVHTLHRHDLRCSPGAARVAGRRDRVVGRRGGRAPRRGECGTDHRGQTQKSPSTASRRPPGTATACGCSTAGSSGASSTPWPAHPAAQTATPPPPPSGPHRGARRRQRPGDHVGGSPARLVAVRLPRRARRTVGLPSRLGASLVDSALRPEGRSGLSGVAVRDGLADSVTLTTKSDEPGSDRRPRG